MARWIGLLVSVMLVVVLAACGGDDDTSPVVPPQQGASNNQNNVIQWEPAPDYIVFQADTRTIDSDTDFFARTEIPECTIYGDGRVIWTVEAEDPLNSVLIGPVDEQRIRNFVETQTYRELYSYDSEADLQLDSDLGDVETLILHVNDIRHITDSFSGWNREYYETIRQDCTTLSPRPQIYQPDGFYVRVEARPYDNNAPSAVWDAEASGLDLAAAASSGEPTWVEGRLARLLWSWRQRASALDLQYNQGGENYVIAMEIPYVTRAYPGPPPDDANTDETSDDG
jgi:hypothetical protein